MAEKKESGGAWNNVFKPILFGIIAFFIAVRFRTGGVDDLSVSFMLAIVGIGLIAWLFVLPGLRGVGKPPATTTDSPSFVAKPTPKWEDKLKAVRAEKENPGLATVPATEAGQASKQEPARKPAAAPKPAPKTEAVTAPTPAVAKSEPVTTDMGQRPMALDKPRGGRADDLKMIKGVGPRLEKLLHKLGFYHFDQIAAWSPEEVAWVDEHLEGFKGRVTRDNWVRQASLLAGGGETAFSSRVAQGEVYD